MSRKDIPWLEIKLTTSSTEYPVLLLNESYILGKYLLKCVWLFAYNVFMVGSQEPVKYYLYAH